MSGRAGIFEEWALEGIFEEWVLEDREPPQGWKREPETNEGWTEPAGMTERREGPVQSLDQSPSLSDPPSHVQQSQLYNQLTLSHDGGGGALLRALTVRGMRSHSLRHSPTWQALLPALAP